MDSGAQYYMPDAFQAWLGSVVQRPQDPRAETFSYGPYYSGASKGPTYTTENASTGRGVDSGYVPRQVAHADPYADVRKLEAPMTADTFSQFSQLNRGMFGNPNAGSTQLEQFMNYLPRLYPELMPVASDYMQHPASQRGQQELGLLTQAMNMSPTRWQDSAIPGLSQGDLSSIMGALGPYAYAQGYPNGMHRKNTYPSTTLLNDIQQYGLKGEQTIADAKKPGSWLWNEGPSGLQRLGGLGLDVLPFLLALGGPFLTGGPGGALAGEAGGSGAGAAAGDFLVNLPGGGIGGFTAGQGLTGASAVGGGIGSDFLVNLPGGGVGPVTPGSGWADFAGDFLVNTPGGGISQFPNTGVPAGGAGSGLGSQLMELGGKFGNLAQGMFGAQGAHGAQQAGGGAVGGGGLSQAQLAALTAMNDERHRGLAPTFEQRSQGGKVDTGLAGQQWIK